MARRRGGGRRRGHQCVLERRHHARRHRHRLADPRKDKEADPRFKIQRKPPPDADKPSSGGASRANSGDSRGDRARDLSEEADRQDEEFRNRRKAANKLSSGDEPYRRTHWKILDDAIVPALVEYIKIPAKSPHFDKAWEKNAISTPR